MMQPSVGSYSLNSSRAIVVSSTCAAEEPQHTASGQLKGDVLEDRLAFGIGEGDAIELERQRPASRDCNARSVNDRLF